MGDAVGGQGVEEDAAVALALDTGVEEHEDAAVIERADEAAEALFESDDGVGNLEVEEGFAAGGFDGGHAGLDDGVRGDGEGEAVDDDAGELLALNIDALPEGAGGEEDGVGGVAELLEQDVARGGALQEERVRKLLQHALVDGTHLGVGGEEAEGAAFSDLEHAADALRGLGEEVGLAGVGHGRWKIEQRLLLIVEVAGDDELSGAGEAKARGEVREGCVGGVCGGHGEGGGGEDDGGVLVKKRGGEERGYVDRGGLKLSVGLRRCHRTR